MYAVMYYKRYKFSKLSEVDICPYFMTPERLKSVNKKLFSSRNFVWLIKPFNKIYNRKTEKKYLTS